MMKNVLDIPVAAGVVPADQTLRVNIGTLEELMTLVSELVLTRNQILQIARTKEDTGFNGPFQRLNHIVSELQDGVMKTRMQPVGNAWSGLPGLVRDIGRETGKAIELRLQGEETELDRQVLDTIREPLMQLARAAAQGIETPAERAAAGKPASGRISLNSYHEGGHIIIEVSDDGRGVPADDGLIAARAGMEKIGGSVDAACTEGQGTCFTIKIPLTLAIVSALIVDAAGERFAIPQLDVHELVMTRAAGPNRLETIGDRPFLRLRGRILPLVSLRGLLGFPARDGAASGYVAVIQTGSARFGLIVDRVFDTEDIVVKPVSALMNGQTVFSGNTILGDGEVIMILDPAAVIRASGMEKADMQGDNGMKKEAAAKKETSLLLFESGAARKAVPLEQVARLEEIDLARVERAGNRTVLQYCGALMPLRLSDPSKPLPATGKRQVIVYDTGDGPCGFVVDRIVNITSFDEGCEVRAKDHAGGTAIVMGRATEIIDLLGKGA